MESIYKKTTIACTSSPAAFSTKVDSIETTFNLHYQVVLRIREEAASIEEKWRLRFYQFIAGCAIIGGGKVEKIGGSKDCVHLLIALPSTKTLAEFLREVKLLSQTWARRKLQIRQFAWQDASEALTVSPTQRERIKALIRRQGACNRNATARREVTQIFGDENLPCVRFSKTDFNSA